jgi:DNA repair protein RadC
MSMHEGHRQRLWEKLEGNDNLYEHELLEILLYNAYPRIDTNPIAHALLNRFASIKEVINASIDELCLVEGVGKNVALYLKCIGRCVESSNNCDSFTIIKNTEDLKKLVSRRFKNKSNEFLEFYFMDKGGRVKRIYSYTSNDANRVEVKTDEVIKLISVYHPYGVFMAHNHINSVSQPSRADDEITKTIQLICSMNNVKLYDHCVYCTDNDIYSYYISGKINKIKTEFSVESVLKKQY